MTILVLTGGTASMVHNDRGVDIEDDAQLARLLRSDPLLASSQVVEWGTLPSTHLLPSDAFALAELVQDLSAKSDDAGVVIVHGTDAMEEMALALDLLLDIPGPVVLTGAMTPLDAGDYDGLDNLRAAARVARSPAFRDVGVVVVMGGEVHAASDVTKIRTTGRRAFESPHLGRMGHVTTRQVIRDGRVPVRTSLRTTRFALPIPLITAGMGNEGREVDILRSAGIAGLVIAGAGSGQTHPGLLASCTRAMSDGLPVVLATRCPGGTPDDTYSYDGGGRAWREGGAIIAGWLSPTKARLVLAMGLGAGLSRPDLDELFGAWRTLPPSPAKAVTPPMTQG
jgi:L-asparaginase